MFLKRKVFCIGRNKTGTTSLAEALEKLGYRLGNQSKAELLIDDWARRDFRRIIRYCRWSEAFQDIPFSLDYTYQAVDKAFPGSKFILTVRDTPEQWYESLVSFHAKIVGGSTPPTADELKSFMYQERGFMWRVQQLVYRVDEKTLYDRERYIAHYNRHNERVLDYFRYRPNDLLILNLAKGDAMKNLYDFLGKKFEGQAMPHLNRSR